MVSEDNREAQYDAHHRTKNERHCVICNTKLVTVYERDHDYGPGDTLIEYTVEMLECPACGAIHEEHYI